MSEPTKLKWRNRAKAILSIAKPLIEQALIEEMMEPTKEMLMAALPIVDLENLPSAAKEIGAAAVMEMSGARRIKPSLEGEAVVQAAQLYVDFQAMLRTFATNRDGG